MRSTWTDSRLDDLNGRVDKLGARMDEGFQEVRGEIGALTRTIIQVGGGLIVAVVTLIAAMLGLLFNQLQPGAPRRIESPRWPTSQSWSR